MTNDVFWGMCLEVECSCSYIAVLPAGGRCCCEERIAVSELGGQERCKTQFSQHWPEDDFIAVAAKEVQTSTYFVTVGIVVAVVGCGVGVVEKERYEATALVVV